MEDIIKAKKEPPKQNATVSEEKKSAAVKTAPTGVFAEWQAPEYAHYERSTDWYWMIGILTFVFAGIGVWMKNLLFVIIALLAGFAVALYSARRPSTIRFAVSAKGLQIDDRVFPYDTLESFWIHYDPPRRKEIGIISKKILMPRIVVPLGDADPNDIRAHLIKFVKEERHEESLTEALARYIGF